MSKVALKKELMSLSHDQLVQVVMDAYNANKEFKEYFNFFLNPDVKKLHEKHVETVAKEIRRSKYSYSKMRVTVVKNAVKRFMGFNPGPEAVLEMLLATLWQVGVGERYLNFNESQIRYATTLTQQIMRYADEHQMASTAIERLAAIANHSGLTVYFRDHVRDGLST